MIVNTSAMITLVNEKLIPADNEYSETVMLHGLDEQLVTGKIIKNTSLKIDGVNIHWDVCKAPLTDAVILGLDILDTLCAVINRSTPTLTINNKHIGSKEEKLQLGHLLLEFKDVFAKHDLDLGCLTAVRHKIDTKDNAPVKHRMQRTPLEFQDLEQQHLDKLLNAGVITPSSSEWASAPVLVRKKDGTVRRCIDYRALNDRTVKYCFPIPIIEDCLDSLQGTTNFCTFWTLPVVIIRSNWSQKTRKNRILTRYGLFEYTRMGIGLAL
ncbi:unnamed protein product [Mytilus coruscus]|uniref:Reverse transcriptase domain-containing protein n=1 Tax=Mytilus coruscus TaxID=42192 RepID=A0A6J8DG11_MYTCO|nr:unnamed protein product [Mytilus coruscus]